jgi:carboxypeptidase Taq|tara:strand:- start:24650 stop:26155 length:1506 start_codon:yes stop_codon:yes gene_type:complete
MSAYEKLQDHFRRISHLNHVQQFVSWDEAAMMPVGGGEARGEAMATLDVVVHELTTDPKLEALLTGAASEPDLSEWERANLEWMKRKWSLAICVPSDLVEAQSRAAAKCEQSWRELRANNDWNGLLPLLKEVLNLTHKEAELRSEATGLSQYDALLDLYEPGLTSETIAALFADLKSFLPPFVDRVLQRQSESELFPLPGPFAIDRQRKLALTLMNTLGFDMQHGRLDVSHHPFCGGVPDDVRITTRYRDDSFLEALMAVLHETGHALYEQGLPGAWRDQPVGEALGMAIHESQSLLMEMQACRTEEFLHYVAPILREGFPELATDGPAWSVDNLHQHYIRVEKGFIRVDADEVTYPLHIILRFELEQELLSGRLPLTDLPEAWDAKMQQYLGLSTRGNDRDGCMQDVHWMAGIFGYFPTYSLGAMTAAQLFAAAKRDSPELLAGIGRGDFTALLSWLRTNVHGMGCLLTAQQLLTRATGGPLDSRHFKEHLQRRYGDGVM